MESNEPLETKMMLEIATEDWISDRFPTDETLHSCQSLVGRRVYSPIVTLDKNVFGGRTGGLAQELVTMIGWALEGKETYEYEEKFI